MIPTSTLRNAVAVDTTVLRTGEAARRILAATVIVVVSTALLVVGSSSTEMQAVHLLFVVPVGVLVGVAAAADYWPTAAMTVLLYALLALLTYPPWESSVSVETVQLLFGVAAVCAFWAFLLATEFVFRSTDGIRPRATPRTVAAALIGATVSAQPFLAAVAFETTSIDRVLLYVSVSAALSGTVAGAVWYRSRSRGPVLVVGSYLLALLLVETEPGRWEPELLGPVVPVLEFYWLTYVSVPAISVALIVAAAWIEHWHRREPSRPASSIEVPAKADTPASQVESDDDEPAGSGNYE